MLLAKPEFQTIHETRTHPPPWLLALATGAALTSTVHAADSWNPNSAPTFDKHTDIKK